MDIYLLKPFIYQLLSIFIKLFENNHKIYFDKKNINKSLLIRCPSSFIQRDKDQNHTLLISLIRNIK